MTVKELYDYITKHITPEEALMKLLEGGLIQYEKLKFDSQEQAVHPLIIIANAAMDMNWQMAIEKKHEDVRGISVGTKDYMKDLFLPKTEPLNV